MIGAVCVVTDPDAAMPVIEQARAAARGGAWAVQLRDKTASDAVLHALATELLSEMEALGGRLIVNDRIEVALSAGAHGLHIGQGDGDPKRARERLGPGRILGLSVETPEQTLRVPSCIDYIGAGPVRATATKPDHALPIGMAGLALIAATVAVPTIAIGGLGTGDAAALKDAGAAGLAVVTAVTRAADPEAATRALVREWRTT